MKKDRKEIIVVICIALVLLPMFSGISEAYNWPVEPYHVISGTLGDYRSNHLHRGVDIAAPVDREVYSVEPGLVTKVRIGKNENDYIIVGDFKYLHIKNFTYSNYSVVFPNGSVDNRSGTSIAEQDYAGRTVEIVEANSELLRYNLPTVNESSNAFYVPITKPIVRIRHYPKGNHLHFEEKADAVWTTSELTNRTNPLREGGLTPFHDSL